ncbi:MAG TPA: archaellin/type IV pilin N-terminal domain-containing protein [Thermoplasmata archaeon]|nr:archaellin/type IV pilin N-terminal domain-containing protein [Thermoplasmata archaeon]
MRPFARRRSFRGRRGISETISAVLLVVITVILVVLIYAFHFPLKGNPPNVSYQVNTGFSRPVWGDPTDCYPNLPHPPSYYLGHGQSRSLYNTYMNAWWDDCEYGDSGTYNNMNVSAIQISQVSSAIPLQDVEFQFICTNTTPKYVQTTLVEGPLYDMEWEPGSSQNLSANAPKLGFCATYDAGGFGGGANSVYYNRLGYFDPLNANAADLAPGQTLIIYVHTPDSVLEAPNPLEPVSTWNVSDGDDYHGAPPWCFTVVGACEINLIDTAWSPNVILTSIPLYIL